MASGGYVINVGRERPEEAIVAHVKKNGEPVENTKMKRFIQVGTHLLINRCRVWGRRVMRDETGKKVTTYKGGPIEVTTPGYAGEVEPLKWHDKEGHGIELRYLENSRSLDVEYQDIVQKIKIDLDRGMAQLELAAGENKFDPETQALLITFLKAHPQNRDSTSKNPDPAIKAYAYYEKTDEAMDKASVKRMEVTAEAGFFVKTLSEKPAQIRNVFYLMSKAVDFGQTDKLSNDGEIYRVLLNFAQSDGPYFMSILGEFRKDLSDAFVKADSYNLIDLTKDGVIAVTVNQKTEIIFSNIPAKGEKMKQWVFDHFYEEAVYEGIDKFKTILEKIK